MHDPLAPPGLVGHAIVAAGGHYHSYLPHERYGTIRVGEPVDLPADDAGWDGLIVLGGTMHAGDDAGFPHFPSLLELIRQFDAAAKPVLGICLGAQLVGRAFGQRVRRQGFVERGFAPIRLTAAAADDPLLTGLDPAPWLLHWHEDRVDLPDGAVHLAASDACSNQIFRLGRATYGFQCHFEATADIARAWVRAWSATAVPTRDGFAARFEADLARHMSGASVFGLTVARRWLALCAKNG